MNIFAHRGFSARYPENTMLAFQKALEIGSNGIEFDVHFSRDHKLVIIHDESLSRTIDAVGFVRHHSYRDLKNYNVKGNYEGERQHIITLEGYLEWAQHLPLKTNIELKNDRFRYPGMEEAVIEAVRSYGMEDKIILSSFRADSVEQIKTEWPKINVAWLVEELDDTVLQKAKAMGVDAIHPMARFVTPEIVDRCHEAGILVRAYTVNTEEDMERMREFGVDAIFTDHPERAREFFGMGKPRFEPEVVELAQQLDESPFKTAKERLKLSKRTKRFSGGILAIFFFMVLSVTASVLAAKLVMGLLGRFF